MADRCVPGPIESCTMVWRVVGDGAQARLQAHIRPHPTGGIEEVCADQVGDDQGIALSVHNGRTVEEPAGAGQDSGLRFTSAGELWVRARNRKTKVIPAGTNVATSGNSTLIDNSITIDTSQYTAATCWELCIDVKGAYLNRPYNQAPTVNIPNDDGSSGQHDHTGQLTVTEYPASTTMALFIGSDTGNEIIQADRTINVYSGRLCTELTLPAGTANQVPIRVEVLPAASSIPFASGSGTLTVFAELIECSEVVV